MEKIKCLNCGDIKQITKEQKCPCCGAILPFDLAIRAKHHEQCKGR